MHMKLILIFLLMMNPLYGQTYRAELRKGDEIVATKIKTIEKQSNGSVHIHVRTFDKENSEISHYRIVAHGFHIESMHSHNKEFNKKISLIKKEKKYEVQRGDHDVSHVDYRSDMSSFLLMEQFVQAHWGKFLGNKSQKIRFIDVRDSSIMTMTLDTVEIKSMNGRQILVISAVPDNFIMKMAVRALGFDPQFFFDATTKSLIRTKGPLIGLPGVDPLAKGIPDMGTTVWQPYNAK